MSAPYTDGTFTSVVVNGPARFSYPLQSDGDYATVQIEQDYTVLAPNIPAPSGIGSSTFPSNANAYLMAQTGASVSAGAASITRTFCEVPDGSNVYGISSVARPDVPVTSYLNPDDSTGRWYDVVDGTGALGTVASVNSIISWDADYFISLSDPAQNEFYGPSKTVSSIASLGGNDYGFTVTGHGVESGEPLVLLTTSPSWDQYVRIPDTNINVVNANYLEITIASGNTYTSGFYPFIRNYAPGGDTVRTRRQIDYYLPGVTPNISTPADIPIPAYGGAPSDFISSLLAGDSEITYQVNQLDRWNGWPIYRLEVGYINTEDL